MGQCFFMSLASCTTDGVSAVLPLVIRENSCSAALSICGLKKLRSLVEKAACLHPGPAFDASAPSLHENLRSSRLLE
jgi:hypothetical protein